MQKTNQKEFRVEKVREKTINYILSGKVKRNRLTFGLISKTYSPRVDTFFLALLGEQNLIWIFSNIRLFTYHKGHDRRSKLVAFSQN